MLNNLIHWYHEQKKTENLLQMKIDTIRTAYLCKKRIVYLF